MKKTFLILTLMVLTISCFNNDKSKNSESVINKTTNKESYFKGIIRFEETYNSINENISKSLISITVDGENVKREVKHYSFGILDTTVGMVYYKNKDSIYYYNTTKTKTHCTTVSKAAYLGWVKTRSLEIDSIQNDVHYDWEVPFGVIFSPLEDQVNLNVKIAKNLTLMKLKNCELMTLLFNKTKTCTVGYCNDIKLAPGILELIEHNQPHSLKTIALTVKYNSSKNTTSKLDNFLDKTLKIGNPILQYVGHQNQENPAIALPKGTIICKPNDFNTIVYPPDPSSNSSGGSHHHDFF